MAYTNSGLVKYTKVSPNTYGKRTHAIDTITIHCFVGQVSLKNGTDTFSKIGYSYSCNYLMAKDGQTGLVLPEEYASICSSNKANDERAITIETACDSFAPYKITDAALKGLIDLCTDICKRNGIKKLVWSTNKTNRVNHTNGCNLTVHRDYRADKSCPGDYIYSKMGYIATEVNKRLEVVNAYTYYQGLDYSLVFDATYYASKYADLKAAFGTDKTKLFNHFINNGMKESRQAKATFNVVAYKNNYVDLQKAFGNDMPAYYRHYITNGYKENRKCL